MIRIFDKRLNRYRMMIQEMPDTGFGTILTTGVEEYWIGFSKNLPAITRRISKSFGESPTRKFRTIIIRWFGRLVRRPWDLVLEDSKILSKELLISDKDNWDILRDRFGYLEWKFRDFRWRFGKLWLKVWRSFNEGLRNYWSREISLKRFGRARLRGYMDCTHTDQTWSGWLTVADGTMVTPSSGRRTYCL